MSVRGNTRNIISRRIIDYKIVNTYQKLFIVLKIPRSGVCYINQCVSFLFLPNPFTIITIVSLCWIGPLPWHREGFPPIILPPITIDILLLAFRFHRLLRVLNFNIPMRKRHPDLFHRTIVCYNPHKRRPNSEAQIIKKEFDYAFPKISPILLFERSELAAVLVILVALVNLLESIFIIIVGTALVLVFRNNEKSRIIVSVF